MASYTADAVALLVYLVDSLPQGAEQVFAEAEAGETRLSAPTTALAEVLYAVSRDRDVRGVSLNASPDEVREVLLSDGPVSVAPTGEDEFAEYVTVLDGFSIHDALVVASHRANSTDAIVTSDRVIRESDIPAVWD